MPAPFLFSLQDCICDLSKQSQQKERDVFGRAAQGFFHLSNYIGAL